MERDFASLAGRQFDLLVCGGGIYGAWTAYDAALRGLSVALVDQGDWAGATSSASSKLIHGGLRYLETYDFRLVHKALRERSMLLRVAPHRVWPLRFGVPIYQDSRVGRLRMEVGLTLYDLLAGNSRADMTHRRFGRESFCSHFPVLNETGLKGGFSYGDAQTDDARLVLELVCGALQAGAVCVNYCKLLEVQESGGRACGAVLQDQLDGTQIKVSAMQLVNTSGQWMATEQPGRGWCRLSKGVHLVMPSLPSDEALLLTAQADGRVFFLIPWYGRTLLGTTDDDYHGDIEHVEVEAKDIDYLLSAANHYLKTAWTEADIIGRYAGVRVMKHSDAAHPSSVSRDWELQRADNNVLYSIGGKITSSREDAACIVDAVCAQLGRPLSCATDGRPFPWAPPDDYASWQATQGTRATQLKIDAESARWLLRRHGKRVEGIFDLIEHDASLAARIVPDLPFIHADLQWCARHEMMAHPDDLLRRRLPLTILTKPGTVDLQQLVRKWDSTS